MTDCKICNNTGWVCERCGAEYESCAHDSAAGKACDCNPNGYYEFAEIIAEVEDYPLHLSNILLI